MSIAILKKIEKVHTISLRTPENWAIRLVALSKSFQMIPILYSH